MASSGPPDKLIPMPTGSLDDMSARMKGLKSEARDADKEIAKAAKKGQDVSADMIKRSASIHKELEQQKQRIEEAKRAEKSFKLASREGNGPNSIFADLHSGYQEAHGYLHTAMHVYRGAKHIINAFSKPEQNEEKDAFDRVGSFARGAGDVLTPFLGPEAHFAGEIIGGGVDAIGGVSKARTQRWGRAAPNYFARSFGEDTKDEKRSKTEGYGGANYQLHKSGLGGSETGSQLRDRITSDVYKDKFGTMGSLSGTAAGTSVGLLNPDVPLTPEIEAEIDKKVQEAISKAEQLKSAGNKALELGNFQAARQDFKEANSLVKGSVPAWYDPAAMWNEANARHNMILSQARERMGVRTVPGRED